MVKSFIYPWSEDISIIIALQIISIRMIIDCAVNILFIMSGILMWLLS